jgi:LysM repeat protein
MIERVSRYYDGTLAQTPNKYTGDYEISVFRNFPSTKTVKYITYIWKDGDTLSALANQYGSGVNYWWEIMDINPQIADPFSITPGTLILVPYGN